MLTIDDIECLAIEQLEKHNLSDWKFRWDSGQRRAGLCSYATKTISLSFPIYSIENNRSEAIDTILHEVAHALTPGAQHGYVWQRMVVSIGGKADRCHELETAKGNVIGTCNGCGQVGFERHRMPKAGMRYKHRCGGFVTYSRDSNNSSLTIASRVTSTDDL